MTATAAKKTDFQFLAGILFLVAAFCLWRGGFINFGQIFSASAAALCPVTDGGAGDDDSVANGTIKVSTTQTWTALSADYWNCTGKDIRVTATGTLNLQGSTTLGYIPQIYTDNLTVDFGGKISADGKGCTTSAADGYGPSATNVCTYQTAGGGIGTTSGAGGGSYGGAGGAGSTYGVRSAYGSGTAPTYFGSSGGSTYNNKFGGAGGGVVVINVSNTFSVNGTISANGNNGVTGDNSGGTGGVRGGGRRS